MHNTTLQDLMRQATQLTQAGNLTEATAAIQRALSGAPASGSMAGRAAAQAEAPSMVLDGCVFEVQAPAPADPLPARPEPTPASAPVFAPAASPNPGEFSSGSHTHAGLSRRYKLYVPPGHAGQCLPLVVMLHGCTQNPDDFAAGTGMNDSASEQGFFVLYPEQPKDANPQRCWNWFKHNHQQRGKGEPALIADLTQTVIRQHGIDPRRVYIAGLSAGAAMAAIVADAYPEIFAAAGIHSGLANGVARNLPEALALMHSGAVSPGPLASTRSAGRAAAGMQRPVPTIVFHGDQDKTVHPANAGQVIQSVLGGATPVAAAKVEQGRSTNGRRYTRAIYHGEQGQALAEHWLVHGAGHAWSGGSAKGSYTDASGPDATAEMLRFFFEHPHELLH